MRTAQVLASIVPKGVLAPAAPQSVRQWIQQKTFQIHKPITPTSATLYVSALADLQTAFRADFVACASSSFECAVEANRIRNDRALAWPIVKLYYAAYFAGHALMRIFLRSSTWAESTDASAINSVAALWGQTVSSQFPKGQWIIELSESNQELKIQTTGGTGGSHESFWKSVCAFLDELNNQIVASQSLIASDAQNAITNLYGLRSFAASGTLTRIRHDVNYKRGHGVWFPYSMAEPDASTITTAIRTALANPEAALTNIGGAQNCQSFAHCAAAFVGLAWDLTETLHQRFPKTSDDLAHGPIRYLRQCKIRPMSN